MKKFWLSGATLAAVILASGAAQAQIKIGVAGPITGANAAFGAQLQKGAQQAIDDINAKGGLMGQKLELEVGDDASVAAQGVSVANKFVGDGVKFVVGHFNSGVTIPASLVYAENGMMAITPAATNPCVTDRKTGACGDQKEAIPDLMMFRTCGRDDQQGALWADFVEKNYKGKNVAVLDDKTPYGQGLADVARKALEAKGVKLVVDDHVSTGDKDFSALVSKLKAGNADIVLWGGLHTEGGLLIRQMRDQGLKTVMLSGDGIVSNEFANIGGPGVVGTKMTFGADPQKNPAAAEVIKEFTAASYVPEGYTLYSYASVQVIAAAITKAGDADPAKASQALYDGLKVSTVIGDLSFDKKGDRTSADYVLYTWNKGADGKIGYTQD